MAEENKKPKIDLRARLGKKTVGAGAAVSIPPPMHTGASIPAPPFASRPPPMEERPKVVAPQAIKIEMSEEVVLAQKKGKSKIMALAAGTAVVGALLGIAIGGGMERRKRQDIAVEGAKLLVQDIDKANIEIGKMADILEGAKRAISDGEFPTKQMGELAEVSVPFDGTYLAGKGTGLMSPQLNKMLMDFSGKSQQANEQKDRLQRMLTASESAFKKVMEEQEKPRMDWAVFIANGPHGPMAVLQAIPEPFLMSSKEKVNGKDYSWPEEVEIPEGDKKVKLKLYKKDNPIDNPPLLIPVDPKSQSVVYPRDQLVMGKLREEIVKLEVLLRGDKSDPTNEQAGIVDLGQSLMDELKGIGG
jgi:hypothetical protein